VSPKKTWEGAAAGVAGTLAAMAAVRVWLLPGLPAGHLLGLGLLAALLGQLGDLCESLLKRGAGAKDSGALLPGHGGFLDRLDSLLFVAPLVYYYVWLQEVYP
jgi:phosphatidate cytidylyltransferase